MVTLLRSNNKNFSGNRRSSRHGRASSQRSRRRHGRRHRQRNQRNSRIERDESWYFPDERSDETSLTNAHSRDNIIAANNTWIQALTDEQQDRPNRPTRQMQISPLVRGNRNHTITWRDNSRTLTLTTDQDERRREDNPQQQPEQNTNNIVNRAQADNRVPNGSHPDVNFNLDQRLRERNRALQQLDQAASQIQVAAAAAAASYNQLIASQRTSDHNSKL